MKGKLDMSAKTDTVHQPSKSGPPLFLALWSIRHLMRREPIETLELIQEEWGIDTVEVATYLDWRATEFSRQLERHGLKVCSLAGPSLSAERDSKYYVEWAKKYLVVFKTSTLVLQCPRTDTHECSDNNMPRNTDEDIGPLLIKVAQDLDQYDKRLSYHCYPQDFASVGEQSFVSRLFARTDVPNNLGLQLDTFWLNHGQTNPDAYARLRVHSVHLNERDEEGRCCLLGTDEEKCAKYIRPLMKRKQPIDWILENDSSDEKAQNNDKQMTDTIEKCIRQWPVFWRSHM